MAPDSVKEQVLEVLAEHDAMRLTEIHRALQKRFNARHTVQGTKKALAALQTEGVVEATNQQYGIRWDWASRQLAFLNKVMRTKTREKAREIDFDADYSVVDFENLFELDNFWNATILRLAREERLKTWIALNNFSWFLILNIGFESTLISDLKKLGFACTVGVNNAYALNRWALQVYRGMGARGLALDKKDVFFGTDVNVVGDSLIEVRFDKNVFAKIKSIFSRYQRIEDIPPKTVSELATRRGSHQLKITRDSLLARQLRQRFG